VSRTHHEIISEFELHLQNLSYPNRLRLIIEISKSLFFDYKRFVEIYQWGNPDLLLDAIAISEQSLVGGIDILKVKQLAVELHAIIPDTADFGEYLGSYALNATLVVYNTLHFILDKKLVHVIDAGALYLDTIHFRIQEKIDTPGTLITDHPSMTNARDFLIRCI
jgi:uncharacterized protein YjaG (DUF416 family)